MAVPGSLQDWRAFVDRELKRPAQLTTAERDALAPAAREDYDERRVAWLSADVVLATPDLVNIRRLWTTLRAETLSAPSMSAKMLSISGSPTMGKTTTATWIARDHERKERARHPTLRADEFQPSLYIVTPPSTTPKMLMTAFCNVLGLPYTRANTAQHLTERLIAVLRTLRTSLVVVDEIHNVESNKQVGAEAASTLKLFAERLDCAFILCGVDLERSAVFAGPVGAQLASRSLRYNMHGSSYGTADARAEWNGLVATCADLLPFAESHERLFTDVEAWLFQVTGGSIGLLRAIVRHAAIDAIESGRERIGKRDLEYFAFQGVVPRTPSPRAAAQPDDSAAYA